MKKESQLIMSDEYCINLAEIRDNRRGLVKKVISDPAAPVDLLASQ
jgi:hypothetical protein